MCRGVYALDIRVIGVFNHFLLFDVIFGITRHKKIIGADSMKGVTLNTAYLYDIRYWLQVLILTVVMAAVFIVQTLVSFTTDSLLIHIGCMVSYVLIIISMVKLAAVRNKQIAKLKKVLIND